MTRGLAWQDPAHTPSRGNYVQGCRCAGCKEQAALYARKYRNQGGTRVYTEILSMLRTPCWCEAKSKLIPAADVAAGRTWSCGREGCRDHLLNQS